jgi:hypothetical protein
MIIHFVEQSSRFHLKTTTLRDEGIKTNTDGFRSQNEGFRPSMEGIRTPIDAFRVQNDGFRSQDVSRDLFSPSIREKDSVNSEWKQVTVHASRLCIACLCFYCPCI